MSRKELREAGRVTVQTDGGERMTLVEYTTFVDAAGTWVAGLKEMRTLGGEAVNVRGDGQYETLFGQKLTRVEGGR